MDAFEELEKFVLDNEELIKLEDILHEFNFFDVLNVIYKEQKHSDILAWLMDPHGNHMLGDYFLKNFLKSIKIDKTFINTISPIEIDVWDLSNANVLREWNNIDIFIVDEMNRFYVVIENKILSQDHDAQLSRYRDFASKFYKGYKSLYLYLTPDGSLPQEEAEIDTYESISYDVIYRSLGKVLSIKKNALSSEVYTFVSHYMKVLRRNIMNDSEIAGLVDAIYKKHRKALDIIFELKSNKQKALQEYLKDKVDREDALILDRSTGQLINFSIAAINQTVLAEACSEIEWTKTKKGLLFECQNKNEQIELYLYLGPCSSNKALRKNVYEYAYRNQDLFNHSYAFKENGFNANYIKLYSYPILSKDDYFHKNIDELYQLVDYSLNNFIELEIPKFERAMGEIFSNK